MHGNCKAYTWMLETADTKLFVMHGEHTDWAEMMRFVEYVVYRFGIRERCNVLYKRVNWKGRAWRVGGFPTDPGQCARYTKNSPKAYAGAKETWDECKGCSFGRGEVWLQRIAVGLRGKHKKAHDEMEGFTVGATDAATSRGLVESKPRPQLGGNNRKRVRNRSDRPGRQRSLGMGTRQFTPD